MVWKEGIEKKKGKRCRVERGLKRIAERRVCKGKKGEGRDEGKRRMREKEEGQTGRKKCREAEKKKVREGQEAMERKRKTKTE